MASSIRAADAFVSLGVDLSNINAGFKILDAKIKTINAKFASIGKQFSNIGASLTGAGAGLAAAGGGALAGFAFPVAYAAQLETTTAAFETMLKSGDKAKALLGDIKDFAAETPFEFSELADASKKLLAFGSGAETIKDELRTLGDIASGIGQPIGELAELYGKARVQGRLYGEDINQLTGRGIPVIQALAKQFGVSESEVKKLVEQGKVGFPQLQQALKDMTTGSGQFAGGMKRQSQTFLGMVSTLKDNLSNAFLPVGVQIMETLKIIGTVADGVLKVVTPIIEKYAGVATYIALAAAGAVALGGAMLTAGVAISGIATVVGGVVSAVAGIAGVIGTAFSAIAGVIGAVLSPVGLVVAAIVGLTGYIAYLAITATDAVGKVSSMFGGLAATVTNAWGGIVAAVSAGDLQLAGDIAFSALEVGWLTITNTMQSVWTDFSAFIYNVWLDTVESIINAGASIYFEVAKYFDLLSVTIQGAFDTAFTYVVGAIDNIQTAIAQAIVKAQEFVGLFSEEQSVQVRQTLESDLANRAKGRQTGLDRRASDRQAGLDQRGAEREKTAKDFAQTVREDFQRGRAKGAEESPALKAARDKQARLQETLTTRVSEAQTKAAEKVKSAAAPPPAVIAAQRASTAIQFQAGESVGSFSSKAAAQSGFVSIQQEANQKLDAIASATQQTADIAKQQLEIDRE